MLQASDIPIEWRQLLAEVNSYSPAVLAGGCLRDLDHGVEVKDLDIFIECGDEEEAAELNQELGGVWGEQEELKWYPESMREVVLVSDYDTKKNRFSIGINLPVQFIFVNWKMSAILSRFDYGICQIGFNGKDVFWEKAYESDKANKTMTLVRSLGECALAASVERYARWGAKYPEHKWILGCRLEMGAEPIDIGFP